MSRADARRSRERPRNVEDALRSAAEHARRAVAEALAAARALLDAASLGLSGEAAEAHSSLASFAQLLDALEASLGGGSAAHSPLLDALSSALDAEISKWELRAENDREARAVLRAFLGLREVLWELGVRPENSQSPGTRSTRARARKTTPEEPVADATSERGERSRASKTSRVQRIQVQG